MQMMSHDQVGQDIRYIVLQDLPLLGNNEILCFVACKYFDVRSAGVKRNC